jgi:hypothetical protein
MVMDNRNYVLDGKIPIVENDILKWAKFFESNSRTVGDTHIGEVHISTVFLGLDHSYIGPPLLFETMIFGGEHDDYQERYTTWDQAEKGHERAVELVEHSLNPINKEK